MTDPKILDSRKRSVDMPWGSACHILPELLPRPLDKCELFQLEQRSLEKQRLRQLEVEKTKELRKLEADQLISALNDVQS